MLIDLERAEISRRAPTWGDRHLKRLLAGNPTAVARQ
jgi:hypothetical protein